MHTDYFLQRDYRHEECYCKEECLEQNRKTVPAFGKTCWTGCSGLNQKSGPALEELRWMGCSGQNQKMGPASGERCLCLWTQF